MVLTDKHWTYYANRIGRELLDIPINPDWSMHVPEIKGRLISIS
jgi:hypothetical protein